MGALKKVKAESESWKVFYDSDYDTIFLCRRTFFEIEMYGKNAWEVECEGKTQFVAFSAPEKSPSFKNGRMICLGEL